MRYAGKVAIGAIVGLAAALAAMQLIHAPQADSASSLTNGAAADQVIAYQTAPEQTTSAPAAPVFKTAMLDQAAAPAVIPAHAASVYAPEVVDQAQIDEDAAAVGMTTREDEATAGSL